MDEKSNHIVGLSDADFLSFLYSERNRENSLSQHNGWNNWALVGAFVASFCAGYATVKESFEFSWLDVLYYAGGLFALFLIYHSWWRLLTKRERGVDFSKVRMLREVVPYVQIAFIIICAIVSTVLISIFDSVNTVFWYWIAALGIMIVLLVVVSILRNKVVPSYYEELFLPWTWANVVFVTMLTYLMSLIRQQSFKLAFGGYLSDEFFVAICVVACLVILFIFALINFTIKPVNRFDEIIDKYLYLGVSKESTFHEVLKNRMGYGVIDACYQELRSVETETKKSAAENKELAAIKQYVYAGKCDSKMLREYNDRCKKILDHQKKTLNLSETLVNRIKEIVKASSSLSEVSEVKYVSDKNQKCCDSVKKVIDRVSEVIKMLHEAELESFAERETILLNAIKEKEEELEELKKKKGSARTN